MKIIVSHMVQRTASTRPVPSIALLALFVFAMASVHVTAIDWQSPASESSKEWQWSVPVASVTSQETGGPPRAFLWIPPDCARVRGVVVGQHNMEEQGILEHSKFRRVLSELGLAEVWITPGLDLFFRFDQGAGEHFTAMMKALGEESGYRELEFAPIVPIGHSAAASFPWNFAAWNPGRTLAVISVSGQWPFFHDATMPEWDGRSIDGVPGLVTMGEYEWANDRAREGLDQRAKHPGLPLSMLAEPGAGHFDFFERKVEYLGLYLQKAVQYRLPPDGPLDRPVELRPIDPTKQGWLVDRWHFNNPPKAPAAPVADYTGNKNDAFWCFDEEMARATENLGAEYRGKLPQLLGYAQEDGRVVPQNPALHQQVALKFEPLEDGITFRIMGVFLDTVPKGRPEKWARAPEGSPIGHASEGGPVTLSPICGPVAQTSPNTFTLRFDRVGMNNKMRSNVIWLLASHPGDAHYKRAVQQAALSFPLRNTEGADQRLTFPKIPDQRPGASPLKLSASSDANVPVHYYVLAGPAEARGDMLHFTAIPPRSTYPVKVTAVAWQWGRPTEPQLKTAEPVEQTFLITPP